MGKCERSPSRQWKTLLATGKVKNPCGSREKYSVLTAAFPYFEMIISRKALKQDGHRNSVHATKNSPAMLCTTWNLVGTKGKWHLTYTVVTAGDGHICLIIMLLDILRFTWIHLAGLLSIALNTYPPPRKRHVLGSDSPYPIKRTTYPSLVLSGSHAVLLTVGWLFGRISRKGQHKKGAVRPFCGQILADFEQKVAEY